MNNGEEIQGGTVANLNELGYDVVDDNGEVIRHITTGDVRCDIGACDHENHQKHDGLD